jgi:hypothetical protein
MTDSAAAILVCVLDVLGRSAASLPPIELVASPPPGISANAEAFVQHPSPTIRLVTSSPAFRIATCRNRRSLVKLAGIIAHEEYHIRKGPGDEKGAYERQLMTMMRLGLGPDTFEYHSVRKAMVEVLSRRSRPPAPPPVQVLIAWAF